LALGYWLLALGSWLLALGLWLLAFGFWLLAFGLWLLTLGPLCREQAGGGIARRVAGRTPASGSSGQDALSIHPASRLRPRKGRGIGVAFLLVTSLWPRKEK
jgi:hypothetical protein